jgi:hypothetical protein
LSALSLVRAREIGKPMARLEWWQQTGESTGSGGVGGWTKAAQIFGVESPENRARVLYLSVGPVRLASPGRVFLCFRLACQLPETVDLSPVGPRLLLFPLVCP